MLYMVKHVLFPVSPLYKRSWLLVSCIWLIFSTLEQLIDNFMKFREVGGSSKLAWGPIRGRENA